MAVAVVVVSLLLMINSVRGTVGTNTSVADVPISISSGGALRLGEASGPAVYLAGVDVGHQLLALNSTLRAQVERLEELRAEKEVLRLRLLRNGLLPTPGRVTIPLNMQLMRGLALDTQGLIVASTPVAHGYNSLTALLYPYPASTDWSNSEPQKLLEQPECDVESAVVAEQALVFQCYGLHRSDGDAPQARLSYVTRASSKDPWHPEVNTIVLPIFNPSIMGIALAGNTLAVVAKDGYTLSMPSLHVYEQNTTTLRFESQPIITLYHLSAMDAFKLTLSGQHVFLVMSSSYAITLAVFDRSTNSIIFEQTLLEEQSDMTLASVSMVGDLVVLAATQHSTNPSRPELYMLARVDGTGPFQHLATVPLASRGELLFATLWDNRLAVSLRDTLGSTSGELLLVYEF